MPRSKPHILSFSVPADGYNMALAPMPRPKTETHGPTPEAHMTLTLSSEAEGHLAAVAARRGLPPSDALDQILAEARARAEAAALAMPIWKRAAALGAAVPAEERANLPHDGSVNYAHYLYQAPMQPAPSAE